MNVVSRSEVGWRVKDFTFMERDRGERSKRAIMRGVTIAAKEIIKKIIVFVDKISSSLVDVFWMFESWRFAKS